MSDLIKKDPVAVPVSQYGKTILNVEKVDKVQTNQYYMTPPNTLPGMPGYKPQELKFSEDYYNLIVFEQEPEISNSYVHITLRKDRCLVEEAYIAPELKEKYYRLTEENIEELKNFLCIFASENKGIGQTDADHLATVGFITDIKIGSNCIEIYYIPRFAISQERLNETASTFGICGKYKRYNELNHSHWSVKAINLSKAIHNTGLSPI